MPDYIVSARKYRPATFSSVVGQTALTATLKNAINTGKLANTYLFCGPRGVGKTTCARIFAKTINCTNRTPDGEACGECESCRSFNSELRSYNVFELDAASNNSVDDIRTLTEQVRIPPMNGKYKVYIIDEVHMLSTSAFNAFLKTLEEPPKYAIFILATTEKHKIIPTILSRCQIYDFGRISNADITAHLKAVAEKEGITTEPEALAIIAEKSDGGMRDALSIFDQVTSFTNGQVTYAKTIENLNVIDYDYYFRLTDMFLEKRISDSLLLLNDILGKGFDGSHLISGLMLHLRNLLVSRDPVTLPLLEVSDEMRERYKAQAAKCQPKFLYRALKILNDCDLNYRVSKNKRLLVELALIQAAQADEDDDSSGRKPARLRPVFNKTAARLQSSRSAGNQVQATPTPQTQPRSQSGLNARNDALSGNPSQVQPASGMSPVIPDRKQAVPTVKSDKLFTSIYGNSVSPINKKTGIPGKDHTPAAASDAALNDPASARPAKPLTDDLLTIHWQEFAASLPRQDTPLKNRMINCKTTVLSPDKFDVFVGNHMVADEINASRERILAHIRESFNNPAIEMTVSVDESRNMDHILTRDEQYARMKEANPSIKELEKVFSLELH
ncbi:MAG: DNA polymerase III subunit gamma/tau [Bacteroidaceae bacterium]|nr:DNA polymerase III subunit gamma/tau [Bacteroidaceae bacterium]